MMEKVFVAKARTIPADKTLICGTRYGNVLCSRGSVVPLFIEQIKAGKPLTITEPSMTRFIMSLDEAVELVLFAFEHAETGDIMVQKAPASTIGDLAQAVKELFNVDSEIKIIGIRHAIKNMKPLLGICLGMQLLGRKSEEGSLPGLGLIPFDNVKFSFGDGNTLKIPHMGWDRVTFAENNIPLLSGLKSPQRYYFVHSYHDVKVLIGTHPSHIFVSTSPVFYSLCKQNGTTFVNRQKFKEIVYADEGKKYGVIIGNDVWIGAGAVLLGGVEIGDGAIISAGAYVKEDIPPYNIFAGQPARRIGQRFTDTRIEWLISLKWWNKSLKWIRNNADSFENIEEFSKKIVFMQLELLLALKANGQRIC